VKTNGVLLRNRQIYDIVGQILPSYVFGRHGWWLCLRGSGSVPFERAILLLLFSGTPLFAYPTSSLPKISSIHNTPTSQTDGRTTCDDKTALCTKVHCAVKSCINVNHCLLLVRRHLKYVWFTEFTKFRDEVKNGPSLETSKTTKLSVSGGLHPLTPYQWLTAILDIQQEAQLSLGDRATRKHAKYR